MNEVNVEPVEVRLELVELIQPPLLRPPVVPVAPVRNQFLEVGEVRSVVPPYLGNFVGEAGPRQPLLQVGQHGVRDVNFEWDDRVRATRLQDLSSAYRL